MNTDPLTINYQTAPLTSYSPSLRQRAADLVGRVTELVGKRRVKRRHGSYSILNCAPPRGAVTAKILMYKGGRRPQLPEGIYILVGVSPEEARQVRTIACGPWWNARFAYFRLGDDQDLDEIADFVVAMCFA